MTALDVDAAFLAGYDRGGRASCITAAVAPQRVRGLVTVDGYNIQSIADADDPAPPEWEQTYWYQYYFQTDRGHRALIERRDELCELLWRTWSPTWRDARAAFRDSAPSLRNPDFADVVVHSYRHRFGRAAGDPRYDQLENQLATTPIISVPTTVIEAGSDGIGGPSAAEDRDLFTGPYTHLLLPDAGHNVPQEDPIAFADAVLALVKKAA